MARFDELHDEYMDSKDWNSGISFEEWLVNYIVRLEGQGISRFSDEEIHSEAIRRRYVLVKQTEVDIARRMFGFG